MTLFIWIQNLFSKDKSEVRSDEVLPMEKQLKAWHRANDKMDWGIRGEEFERFAASLPPPLTDSDRMQGFIGSVLFYGFGDDGHGHADPILSGKLAWEYAIKDRKN